MPRHSKARRSRPSLPQRRIFRRGKKLWSEHFGARLLPSERPTNRPTGGLQRTRHEFLPPHSTQSLRPAVCRQERTRRMKHGRDNQVLKSKRENQRQSKRERSSARTLGKAQGRNSHRD